MSGIIFWFESNDVDVWSGRHIDLDAWNYACKIGGITRAIIINTSDVKLTTFDENMEVVIFDSEYDFYLKREDYIFMDEIITKVVEPNNNNYDMSLWDFDHDTDWYIFGDASGDTTRIMTDNVKSVAIPSPLQGGLHSVHVATTIMLHRYKTIWL